MIITRYINPVSCKIPFVVGHGKKERLLTLFEVTAEDQKLCYDLDSNTFMDQGVIITIQLFELNEKGNDVKKKEVWSESKGVWVEFIRRERWSLETIDKFVDGIGLVTRSAQRFIEAGFEAEAAITEDSYVWSRMGMETVGGGLFSSGEEVQSQLIRFELLGLQSEDVRWHESMLDAVTEMRDQLAEQQRIFTQEVKAVIG
ncbi:hypothetical protein HN388_00370 [bacterium]|jgi:hypothetical protein|nr:hypothetical protein [bacterium]MBT7310883.1 hypothetical protein [bacterium]